MASVVTDLLALRVVLRGGGELPVAGDESLVPMSLSFVGAYADLGWFIVPSAANEYGESYAVGDGFVWDIASGEFTSDWFFV